MAARTSAVDRTGRNSGRSVAAIAETLAAPEVVAAPAKKRGRPAKAAAPAAAPEPVAAAPAAPAKRGRKPAASDDRKEDKPNPVGVVLEKAKAKARTAQEPESAPNPVAAAIEADKPVVPQFHGLAIREGLSIKELEKAEKEIAKVYHDLKLTDEKKMPAYLAIGKFQSTAKAWFPSTKLYGQYLSDNLPESQSLGKTLRSDCTWLYEAINNVKQIDPKTKELVDHEGKDILRLLGVQDILMFKRSGNPSAIKAMFKAAKEKEELKKLAEKAGIKTDDEDKAIREYKDKEKKENAEKRKAMFAERSELLNQTEGRLKDELTQAKPDEAIKQMLEMFHDIATQMFESDHADQFTVWLKGMQQRSEQAKLIAAAEAAKAAKAAEKAAKKTGKAAQPVAAAAEPVATKAATKKPAPVRRKANA